MSKKPKRIWLPEVDDKVECRPVPQDNTGARALAIPDNGKPGRFWPPQWRRRRFDEYVKGLFFDGDIEVRPANGGDAVKIDKKTGEPVLVPTDREDEKPGDDKAKGGAPDGNKNEKPGDDKAKGGAPDGNKNEKPGDDKAKGGAPDGNKK